MGSTRFRLSSFLCWWWLKNGENDLSCIWNYAFGWSWGTLIWYWKMGRVDLHYCSSSSLFWTALLFKRDTEIYSSPSDLTGSSDSIHPTWWMTICPYHFSLYASISLFRKRLQFLVCLTSHTDKTRHKRWPLGFHWSTTGLSRLCIRASGKSVPFIARWFFIGSWSSSGFHTSLTLCLLLIPGAWGEMICFGKMCLALIPEYHCTASGPYASLYLPNKSCELSVEIFEAQSELGHN